MFHDSFVLLDVLPEFLSPEFLSGLRGVRVLAAFVTVPEAPMHEDDRAVFGQDDIWFARELLHMEAESVTQAVQC